MDLQTVIDSVPIHEEQRSARPRRTFTTEFKQHLIVSIQYPLKLKQGSIYVAAILQYLSFYE